MFLKKKKREILSLQIFERKCIGCENCVNRCKRRVLGMIYTEDGSYANVDYPDRCIGCGKCVKVCTKQAIELIIK